MMLPAVRRSMKALSKVTVPHLVAHVQYRREGGLGKLHGIEMHVPSGPLEDAGMGELEPVDIDLPAADVEEGVGGIALAHLGGARTDEEGSGDAEGAGGDAVTAGLVEGVSGNDAQGAVDGDAAAGLGELGQRSDAHAAGDGEGAVADLIARRGARFR